jgi:hypothetical protein
MRPYTRAKERPEGFGQLLECHGVFGIFMVGWCQGHHVALFVGYIVWFQSKKRLTQADGWTRLCATSVGRAAFGELCRNVASERHVRRYLTEFGAMSVFTCWSDKATTSVTAVGQPSIHLG